MYYGFMNKTALIVNTQASRVKKNLEDLKDALENDEFENWDVHLIDEPSQLQSVIKKAGKSAQRIIIGGGDGTIATAIDTLDREKCDCEIGILPLGTANYLARNLNLPLDFKEALERASGNSSRAVYIAKANGDSFFLMCALGLTAAVSVHINVAFKQQFGQFAYVVELFRQLKKHDSFEYEITTDTRKTPLKGTSHQLVVVNAEINKQFSIAPESKLQSKKLQLNVYESHHSKLKLLLSVMVYILTFGRIKRGFSSHEIEKATIKTSPKREYSLDGEIKSADRIDIVAGDHKVNIIC